MKISLTPYMMNTIDFSDAVLVGEPDYDPGKKILTLTCRGIVLLCGYMFEGNEYLKKCVITDADTNMYIPGECRFIIGNVIEYSFICSDRTGVISSMISSAPENTEKKSYGVFVFPSLKLTDKRVINVELSVSAAAPAVIDFDENKLITAAEYYNDPLGYKFGTELLMKNYERLHAEYTNSESVSFESSTEDKMENTSNISEAAEDDLVEDVSEEIDNEDAFYSDETDGEEYREDENTEYCPDEIETEENEE